MKEPQLKMLLAITLTEAKRALVKVSEQNKIVRDSRTKESVKIRRSDLDVARLKRIIAKLEACRNSTKAKERVARK